MHCSLLLSILCNLSSKCEGVVVDVLLITDNVLEAMVALEVMELQFDLQRSLQ